jgi:hypothetical protein
VESTTKVLRANVDPTTEFGAPVEENYRRIRLKPRIICWNVVKSDHETFIIFFCKIESPSSSLSIFMGV